MSSAFCPTITQTILEDEVDDPVYQVGPQAPEQQGNTADLDAFVTLKAWNKKTRKKND